MDEPNHPPPGKHDPPTRNRVMETVNLLAAVGLAAQIPNVTTGVLIAAIGLCGVIAREK
ncbi:hypothetical protein BH92_15420 [Rhodococcoides fascians A21d2]|uniref:hypothetical protein n=1 Tax=Rhodococcoides fascians TaxID=1828 RepID=UPI0012D337A8|nr:hypothetical protein [Rhodococcus fascians]QII01079.1 hypothetical protein BH92_15420 [Rhodococcus fascians A21d2]